jgi:hypothetical protein
MVVDETAAIVDGAAMIFWRSQLVEFDADQLLAVQN